ncbi:MAG: beta-galactosidase [Frankiales bacterium]|nr:beta-galactosidase [Frankiales bacterium]
MFGGDYNPDQWPREVWAHDLELMGQARVSLATVGVFSWANLETAPGRYELGWLDDVLDGLAGAGIGVDLATATASPPPWLTAAHPEALPVDREGRRRWPGARQAYCPSSAVWRERALALVETLAERYHGHPALVMWHVGNEYGCHTARCYCDTCAGRFRDWLADRYGDVDGLNRAWGTAFWSQRYGSLAEVLPPRITPDGAWANPTQQLDYRRFASDLLLEELVAERDVLHRLSPGIPVTTNLMVMTRFNQLDYWAWARELDVVSNDYYPDFADPRTHVEAALSADTVRGLAGGEPWLLMETSPSAVNWQPRNPAKRPGALRRDALQQVARGADGFNVFQVRASVAGAEKFHSGLIPHAGTGTRLWREVVELGSLLERLGEVAGSRVQSSVALVWDWQAWWACELDSHPSVDVHYPDRARALHEALWELGVTVDVVAPGAPLDGYDLVVVPTLYLVDDAVGPWLDTYVRGGGHALVTYFSGVVDRDDHIRPGGYPGAFRDTLGIVVEEFAPLLAGESVSLDDGGRADVWTEDLRLEGAEAVVRYVDGPVPGMPAVTRHPLGEGVAWYVATRTDAATTARIVGRVVAEAGVVPVTATVPGVEVVRRRSDDRSWLFVLNHTDSAATVAAEGLDLVSGEHVAGSVTVPAGGVAVVREGGPA